jgi:hypothetical protein
LKISPIEGILHDFYHLKVGIIVIYDGKTSKGRELKENYKTSEKNNVCPHSISINRLNVVEQGAKNICPASARIAADCS